MIIPYDSQKYQLGKLCKRGHDYQGTGRSLRYKYYVCVECKRELYRANKETIKARQKQKRAANPELTRVCDAAYYRQNRDRFSQYRKNRYHQKKQKSSNTS
jgi:uncharacterized protein with PIN domain